MQRERRESIEKLGGPHRGSPRSLKYNEKPRPRPRKLATSKRKRRAVNGLGGNLQDRGTAKTASLIKKSARPSERKTTEWRPESSPTRHKRTQNRKSGRMVRKASRERRKWRSWPSSAAFAKREWACIELKDARLVYRREKHAAVLCKKFRHLVGLAGLCSTGKRSRSAAANPRRRNDISRHSRRSGNLRTSKTYEPSFSLSHDLK